MVSYVSISITFYLWEIRKEEGGKTHLKHSYLILIYSFAGASLAVRGLVDPKGEGDRMAEGRATPKEDEEGEEEGEEEDEEGGADTTTEGGDSVKGVWGGWEEGEWEEEEGEEGEEAEEEERSRVSPTLGELVRGILKEAYLWLSIEYQLLLVCFGER